MLKDEWMWLGATGGTLSCTALSPVTIKHIGATIHRTKRMRIQAKQLFIYACSGFMAVAANATMPVLKESGSSADWIRMLAKIRKLFIFHSSSQAILFCLSLRYFESIFLCLFESAIQQSTDGLCFGSPLNWERKCTFLPFVVFLMSLSLYFISLFLVQKHSLLILLCVWQRFEVMLGACVCDKSICIHNIYIKGHCA